jgi:hypothetical protein
MPHQSLVKSPWGRTENLIGQRLRRGSSPALPLLWEAYLTANTGLMWHTEPGDLHHYELREIVAALADEFDAVVIEPGARRRFGKKRPEPSALGRNCALFDLLRFWAYDGAETDEHRIAAEAERINRGFPVPLSDNEIAAIVRSVARFMAKRYRPRTGINSRRGRDRLAGAGLPPRGRQVLSGQVTAAGRARATDHKIQAARDALQAAGRRATQKAVAAEAGLSLRTVKSRWRRGEKVQDDALSGNAPRRGARGPQARSLK